ncbi:hypothetical protein V6N12_007190 [Hibiscus sabdariffa]|uniref:Uncharacterized protein n=1 Tax=Hibiscus sabdariffa TaxID=183260 RepID=A0ABR2F133_9ROSI
METTIQTQAIKARDIHGASFRAYKKRKNLDRKIETNRRSNMGQSMKLKGLKGGFSKACLRGAERHEAARKTPPLSEARHTTVGAARRAPLPRQQTLLGERLSLLQDEDAMNGVREAANDRT